MDREKIQFQSNAGETGLSPAGSAADAGMGAAASMASEDYESHPAATPDGEASQLTELPAELLALIGSYLPTKSAAALSQTSRLFHANLTNPFNPVSMSNRRAAEKLLLCVANFDEEAVVGILAERPDLLTMRTLDFYNVHTDTRFAGVSAWEYSLFAGDSRYMANRMLDSIADNLNSVRIKKIAAQQYESHNLLGLECIAKEGTHYFQKHSDFLPLYVRKHYTDPDMAFYPIPTFQAEEVNGCLTFDNSEVRRNADYAALGARLGIDLNPTPGAAGPAGPR